MELPEGFSKNKGLYSNHKLNCIGDSLNISFSSDRGPLPSPDDYMPLSEIRSNQEKMLHSSKLVERASKSALYRDAWGLRKGEALSAESLDELTEIPMISSADYKRAFEMRGVSEIVISDDIVSWHSTSGSSGSPKWLPYTMRDIEETRVQLFRLFDLLGVREDDVIFQFSSAAPMISDAIPYWAVDALRGRGVRVQAVMVSFYLMQFAMPFAMQIQPTMLTGLPSMLMLLAEHLPETSRRRTAERFREHQTPRNLLYAALTRVRRVRPKDLLQRLRTGIFGGDLLDPYRPYVEEEYGMEAYDLYSLTESSTFASECSAHEGLHFWLDNQIAEVIPKSELEREERDPTYTPRAVYLQDAPEGVEGELVLTNFREALPLVRYRTGDLVRVVGTSRCSCGRTHPRVKILGRLDDLINLGGLRFSEVQLDKSLRRIRKHGRVKAWQAVLTREGYKPKLTLKISAETSNDRAFVEELNDRILMDIPGLGTAIKVEMVLPLEVEFHPDLGGNLTRGGKLRRVVYEDSFSGGGLA